MGKLIVIDGLDGSGKHTHSELLHAFLLPNGLNVLKIALPDYAQPSSALVKMYLGGEFGEKPSDVNPYAASTFYAVDRVASFLKFWKNDYEKDTIILADRYTTSNIIHQAEKLPKDQWEAFINWTQDFEYKYLGLPKPDKVLYLDMPPEISRELILARYEGDENKKDIHEKDYDYLVNCREVALYAAKLLSWDVIHLSDGSTAYSKEKNQKKVQASVCDMLHLVSD